MIHEVVAVLWVGLGIVDPVVPRNPFDLFRASCEADETGMKGRDVGGEYLRGVPLGVDRHEEGLDPLSLLTHQVERLCNGKQRRWADVGAIGVAERDQQQLAFEIAAVDRLSQVVGQCEGAAGDCRPRRDGARRRFAWRLFVQLQPNPFGREHRGNQQ